MQNCKWEVASRRKGAVRKDKKTDNRKFPEDHVTSAGKNDSPPQSSKLKAQSSKLKAQSSKTMHISIIAAVAANGVIGRENDLPWRLPADLRFFKSMTLGKPCLMARNTFESLGGGLKGRTNIVLTHNREYAPEGAIVVHSIDEGLAAAAAHPGDGDEIMILGGATLYEQILPRVDRMYLTRIHHEFEGDTHFPSFDENEWKETAREDHEPDEKNHYSYSFITLERKGG